MQAKVEHMPSGVPDVLKQLIWEPVAASDALPVNATEVALAPLIDAKHRVRSVNCVPKFLQVFQKAKTEADQAVVLVVLRATATASDAKLSAASTAAFEKCGGLKIAKKWLSEAVEWNYSDLLVLLLDVLKVLPVQLTSITEARINEPIVKLRKNAQEEKVKRAAQDLLKHWRGRFTEKEKEKTKPAAAPAATNAPAPAPARPDIKMALSSSPTSSTTTTAAPKPTEGLVKESKALKQRRPIKWLDQAPSTSTSKSSELIGNLMQRKSAKDAASSKAAKDSSSDNKESSSSGSSSKQVSSEGSTPSQKPPKKEEISMQLPAIQSFKVVATTSVSKKIRWADEEGKELVKVKLIESWRDMIHHSPHDENSFKDAKLREHEAERLAMKSHKDRESFHIVIAHEWVTPALLHMPKALSSRRAPVQTEEVEVQSARTRREMEFLVLDGEVPPVSPKEWTRTNEPHRGPPKEIPLLDVDAAASAASAPQAAAYGETPETNEERALREALGPLQRSTIALLMENEHVLPMVYEEAQRNGNRIPDGRVVEIIDYHRRQAPPQYAQQHHQPPPRGYNTQAPLASQGYDGGYNNYGGFNNGPPPTGGPGGYDYNRQYGPPQGLKRKAPGGGLLPDAKRPPKRGPHGEPLQCMYFLSPAGCKHGNNCQYAHDAPGGPPPPHMGMGMGGPVEYGSAYGPPSGGRFGGHQPPMGMRGGGGMRGMRGGR